MGFLDILEDKGGYKWEDQTRDQRDLVTQSIISIAFGLIAFLTFCALRPRWRSLYAARKRQKDAASQLPELPQTFFGWIPTLYKITEEEVIASAGLDAFVFLSFFKMAMKFLMFSLFFSLVVILPVQVHYTGEYAWHRKDNGTDDMQSYVFTPQPPVLNQGPRILAGDGDDMEMPRTGYLWIYVVFVYLFSAYAIYLLITETTRIIGIRQDRLGSQSTITDRTFRLSGIPSDLTSEEKIKAFIEDLGIGNVESVMVCRDWKELDDLLDRRMSVLRKLEEAWTEHLGHRRDTRRRWSLSTAPSGPSRNTTDRDTEHENEAGPLLGDDDTERNHVTPYSQARPTTRIWFGFLNLESRKIDAIDYYEEKLRKLDDQIKMVRKKDFQPTPLAFVTMDTTASCQMAVQAILDPSPMQLLANLAPAPSDVIWQNTYLSRRNRMLRAWSITAIIVVLSLFWSALLAPLAGLLSLDSIRKWLPRLADALDRSPISRTLVQTGLPTLLVSLLNVAVPYLYDWLASMQGMVSQGEVELSLISKNFFFTFFNLFGVLTIFGTFSKFYGFYDNFRDVFKELSSTQLAYALASSLERLAPFYVNLIVLQGLGLFPFRLLEFGSVATYPIYLVGAKTPRDYADLDQPPVFNYGYYLPQSILIFIICTVYSVLPGSWLVLFFGLVYFVFGSFIYKYQLLYAMDHRQHSTGKAWPIICNRVILGLVVFQIAIAGDLALKTAIKRSVLIVPLLMGTIWFSYFYRKSYEPLMKFIALRSIHRNGTFDGDDRGESRYDSHTDHGRTVDETEETGKRFINPNLIIPLEDVWLAKKRTNTNNHVLSDDGDENTLLTFRLSALQVRDPTVKTSSQILLSRGVADPYPAPNSTNSSPAAPPIVSVFESDSVHLMTLGSPARTTGYRYTRSATYRAYDLDCTERVGLRELTDSTTHTTAENLEASGVCTTDSGMEQAHTTVASPERSDLFRWNVSDVPSKSSDHHDNSDGPSILTSSPSTPTSGAQSPLRGRPLDISTLQHGLISRETIRRRAGPTSVEFDTILMQERIASRDFTAEQDSLHASTLLGAHPAGRDYRSASEAFFGHTIHGFAGHRDTFALLVGLPRPAPEMPLKFFHRLRGYLSHAEYLSVRLSCREWSAAISYVSPPKLPVVYFVPLEIVQQIYGYLRPVDFNAARHTCRAWMFASLEVQLLRCMLQRGGWRDVIVDAEVHDALNADGGPTSQVWALSKLLARECALGPNWTGNGLRSMNSSFDSQAGWHSPDTSLLQDGNHAGMCSECPSDMFPSETITFSGLVQTARVDFSALGSESAKDNDQGAAVNFTVSVCGKYLLVAEGCMIFIYKLSSDQKPSDDGVSSVGLTAITSVICPRRVLAVSMDTSSHRFAVAALLDGRMGLVCDLDESLQYRGTRSTQRRMHHNSSGFHVSVSPSSLSSPLNRAFVRSSGSAGEREITEPAFGGSSYFDPGPSWSSQHPADNPASHRVHESAPGRSRSAVPGAFARASGIGLETGPRSIYKNLCSDDDPPRSVAICPQRRCVAFGCSAGIELHWVDALTGQDLNRWFPLTAPSDFLYFLPPRKGVDSAKKLRLISSAAHPNEKPAVQHHFYPAQTMAHMMFGPLRVMGQLSGIQATSDCDHYRAVPLSDGNHILFTDPASGMLCLGNDAPLGGPTKLLRKVMMVGPAGCVPSVYAAGAELRWGVRVAVGYGDRVFLFSIPPDIFRDSQTADTTDISPQDDSWHRYQKYHLSNDDETAAGPQRGLWPVQIHGAEIGRVHSLSDLAIDSSPTFTIWAFSASGETSVWEIVDGSPKRMKTIWITQDGNVDAATDLDGDTIMDEAPPLGLEDGDFESFDGSASVEFSAHTACDGLGPAAGFGGEPPRRERSDVEMRDADAGDDADEDGVDGDIEFARAGGTFAIVIPREAARWSGESADWVPDYLRGESLNDGLLTLLGVAGLECEVL